MATPTLPPVSFELPSDDGVLPTVTPHQVALCFLVKGYLSPGDHDPGGTWPQRQALGDALLTAIRTAPTLREPSINRLAHRLRTDVTQNLAGTSFADQGEYAGLVMTSLGTHMRPDGILDRVVVLFTQLASMVTTSTNSRAEDSVGADDNSVMGFFLRRCWCDFTALSFEETCTLAAACERYCSGANGEDRDLKSPFLPRAVMDRVLIKVVARSECLLPSLVAKNAKLVRGLVEMTQQALPEVHRATLALAVLRRDAPAAVWAVHEQFDAPHNPYLPLIGSIASGDGPSLDRNRQRLQAAALQSAAVALRLRRLPQAVLALGEAIRTAHVARDDACLQHVLAQICSLLETATPGTSPLFIVRPPPKAGTSKAHLHAEELRASLEKLQTRAEDLGIPHLGAYARLGLARHALLHPRRYDPTAELGRPGGEVRVPLEIPGRPGEYFKLYPLRCGASIEIAAAARYVRHLHLAAAVAAAVPAPPPTGSNLACLRILKGLSDMFISLPKTFGTAVMGAQGAAAMETRRLAGGACLLRAAGWSLHGGRRLAQGHVLAFLQSQGRYASFQDRSSALAQAAVSVADGAGFAAAEQFLKTMKSRYPDTTANRAMQGARLVITHRRHCHRGEGRLAKRAAVEFISLAEPPSEDPRDPVPSGIQYKMLGEEMIAEAFFHEGNLPAAEDAARCNAWPWAMKFYQPHAHLRLVCLLGRIALAAGDVETTTAYAEALCDQAREQHAELLVAEAVLLRCGVWLRAGRAAGDLPRAIAELDAALPLIMAHGGLDLKARARMLLAECVMEAAPSAAAVGDLPFFQQVIPLLREARRDFRALESVAAVRRSFDLEGLVWRAAGEDAEASRCDRHVEYLQKYGAEALGSMESYVPPFEWPGEWWEGVPERAATAAAAAAPTEEDEKRAQALRQRFVALKDAKKHAVEERKKKEAEDAAAAVQAVAVAGAPSPAPSTSVAPMVE